MKSFIALALFSLVAAQNEPPFKIPQGRIVGGYEVSPKFKYSWMVSLQYGSRNSHACGGTLYNGNTVISAAHCVGGANSDWKAALKRHDLTSGTEVGGGETYSVINRISHPSYNGYTNAYDISIWKISAPAGPSTGVKLDVDNKWSNADGTLLKVIGWGTTSSGGSVSKKLLEVKVPVFNASKCKEVYSSLDTVTQFCAAFPEGGKDSCQGDSGGPLFIEENDVPVLVGIVSWGQGCALKGKPGVYTRTGNVIDWINQNSN